MVYHDENNIASVARRYHSGLSSSHPNLFGMFQYLTGYSDTAFGPKDTITREQLAVMLYRFAKLLGMDTSAGASTLNRFTDKDSVHTWAADAMAWCVSNGIIQGIRDDVLSPANLATRAQVAVMLNRFIGLIK